MKHHMNRRKFLGQASCAGLGYLTFMNTLLSLKSINAATTERFDDALSCNPYKAIVCILLAGGNDSYNMLIPYDQTHHNYYTTARSGLYTDNGLAIPRSELTNTRLQVYNSSNQVVDYVNGGRKFAVHPSMTGVKNLFLEGRAAFLSNIGTLLHNGTNVNHYNNNQYLPIGVFSHSDQIQQWQTGIPDVRTNIGWGGKIAELVNDCNTNQNISMNVSLSGSNIFQTGQNIIEYAINPDGAAGIYGFDPGATDGFEHVRTAAIDSMIGQNYSHIFEKTYADVIKGSRDAYLEFENSIQQSIDLDPQIFGSSYFGSEMRMIAKTIDIRNLLGFKRQIFFVTVGGWDHHDEVINNQNYMLGFVSEVVSKFQEVLGSSYTDLNGNSQNGVDIEDSVLTMVISEFGRTLNSNGNGSDHAWGGNTFVAGGPNLVNGGNIYGNFPVMDGAADANIDIGLGRFIPTLSTDEYFAEIAKWFGVSNLELPTIFPNINEFWTPNSGLPIGFLNSNAI